MSSYKIALLPGDGIGPEVTAQAVALLEAVADKCGFSISFEEEAVGGAAIDKYNEPLPDAVLDICKQQDAILLGAVGGPKWDHHVGGMRPESGLLKLRKSLGVFANLRPVSVSKNLADASPLRTDVVRGTDLLVVRELTGGIYFGEPKNRSGDGASEEAFNTMRYSAAEVERVARVAFEWALKRRCKVTSVDKSNVLVVSQLWRDVVTRLHTEEYSDVELEHMYVDNAAMQLVLNPRQFDVILTGNLFGDILSDAAATLGGSLGLLPSASVGGPVGLFEPVHGSAPEIAGQDKANPIAALLSVGMLLDQLGEANAALAIRTGIEDALGSGIRTADLWKEGHQRCGTQELGSFIQQRTLACMNHTSS